VLHPRSNRKAGSHAPLLTLAGATISEFNPRCRTLAQQVHGTRVGGMTENPLAVGSAENAEGHYANYFKAGHNAFEVILEFGQYYEGDAQPRMHTQIITTPAYAKTFLEVLRDLVERYERAFGPVGPGKPHE
jgi:hypothetical protein